MSIPPARGWSWLSVALFTGVFLVVWGAKLVTIDRFGSDLPNWDQWDAEGNFLFLPWLSGQLHVRDFFMPHNEHRIVCTKLLSLFLLWVNGQWDSRFECVVNAILHAGFAATLFTVGRRWMRDAWTPFWFVTVVALTAPPIAWQNVLGGFHSQQYFLLWTSLAGITLLAMANRLEARWWAGLACGAIALFSMGSGLLAAAAVAIVLALDGTPKDVVQRHGLTLAACLLIGLSGWIMRVEFSAHDVLKSHSLADVAVTFWKNLQWPVGDHDWYPLIAWAPWSRLAWTVLARRRIASSGERIVVITGLWILLQFLATGYARGAGGQWPVSRYLDTVAVGVAINVLASLVMLSRDAGSRRARWWDACVLIASISILAPSWWRHVHGNWTDILPEVRAHMESREINTRNYLATDDRAKLENVDIPFPNVDILIDRLSHPEIRAILPVSARLPLAITGTNNSAECFSTNAVPAEFSRAGDLCRGSYRTDGSPNQGAWKSAAFPASPTRYWRFETAGSGGILTLQDEKGATVTRLAGRDERWTSFVVRAPRGSPVLIAEDSSPSGWFAFIGPSEMATGSYWAWRIARHGTTIVLVGLALAIGTLVLGLLPRLRLERPDART